jgi:hypothetical protein
MKDQASRDTIPVMESGDKKKTNMVGVGADGKCKFKKAERAENLLHLMYWGPK